MRKLQILFCILLGIYHTPVHGQYTLLQNELQKITASCCAQIGITVIFDGKDTLTINNDQKYPLMSVFKYHQALAVAHYLHTHHLSLDTEILIPRESLHPNTYSPLRDKYPDGNIKLPISKLLEYTLQMSDNNACDILFDYIGGVKYADSYLRTLGAEHFLIS